MVFVIWKRTYFLIGLKSSLESLLLPSSSLELSDSVGGPREDRRTPKSSGFFLITAMISSRSFLRFLFFLMGTSSSSEIRNLKKFPRDITGKIGGKTYLKILWACWTENSGHLRQIQNFQSLSYFHYNCNEFLTIIFGIDLDLYGIRRPWTARINTNMPNRHHKTKLYRRQK